MKFVPADAELIIGRHRISLTPHERDMLVLLCDRQPHFVNRMLIATKIWPGGMLADPDNSVRVLIYQLRGKLDGTPASIELHTCLGWRVVGPIKVVK